MSWVLTAERKPTADDADEREWVWVQLKDGSVNSRPAYFVNEEHTPYWHPKPKADKPEPYKPPVQERREWWVNTYPTDVIGELYSSKSAAAANATSAARQILIREVRDGDPSPEDVADVIRRLKELSVEIFGGGWNVHKDELECCIRRLGGKP